MVHGFKIENDKLILDIEEILQYPLLQQIYARDDSKDKSFAEKEFRFILYLSDRKGYVTKAGLTKKKLMLMLSLMLVWMNLIYRIKLFYLLLNL